MKQIIYVEYQDNIATIREKLQHAQAAQVILVVPKRYAVLRDLVNLKLLKRYGQQLAIDLALVVQDGPTRILARELGFVLLSKVDKSYQANPPGKGQGLTPADARSQSPRTGGRPSVASSPGHNLFGRAMALLFLLALLVLFVVSFIVFVLPAATVELVAAVEPVSANMDIVAVPGLTVIDYGQARAPAKIITAELDATAEIATTGRRDTPDSNAEGSVVFANKSADALTIPKGTIVRTSSGNPVRFYTVTDVQLPAERGAHARVTIIAAEPGPTGNVMALTINQVEGEAAFRVDVINESPTQGGGFKQTSVVTAEDRGRLKNALLQRLQQEAYAKLKTQLAEGEFIPAETVKVEVVDEKYSRLAGEAADNLSLRLAVRASGTLAGGEEANMLILRLLEKQAPPGSILQADSLRFKPGEVLAVDGASVRFRMTASGIAISNVREAEVRSAIQGRPTDEALQILLDRWDFEQAPKLSVTPDWLGRVPWLPYRITVTIKNPR